jgi:rRNA-processing protein FCF1
MPSVLIDGENVRRSLWPNLARDELEERVAEWAARHEHDAQVVWEGRETADDTIARTARTLTPPVWVVTSDRELRSRVAPYAARVIGGGSFVREIA